jgi:hypothetical protein
MTVHSIYEIPSEDNEISLIEIHELQILLSKHLVGLDLSGLPLRTRSKVVKSKICEALGYPIPKSFIKSHPRFPCQNLDVMTQKSHNIQIWNEEIDFERRYAVIKLEQNDIVSKVRVVTGEVLSSLDKTGTLTQKHQALLPIESESLLFSKTDTEAVKAWLSTEDFKPACLPTDPPQKGKIYAISALYKLLSGLIGHKVSEISKDQERNRGSLLHKEICRVLQFDEYKDNGAFPDIPNQLIEIKLQTSQTIDLGQHSPNDEKCVLGSFVSNDIRYVIFYGDSESGMVTLKKLFVVNGDDFFKLNKEVKGISKKIQLPIPHDFFN